MNLSRILIYVLLIVAFVAAALAYPLLPEQVASHWNAAGEADGYMGKFWGAFLFPLLMAGFALLYVVIPRIDPLKANIETFRKSYDALWAVLMAFFAYMFGVTLAWNLGARFNFTFAVVPAVSALVYALGVLVGKAKRNWFVGIRTPWTLSSDAVWDKTHKLGGTLFKIAAVFPLAALVLKNEWLVAAFVTGPVLFVAVVVVVYSYVVHRSVAQAEQSKGTRRP